MKRSFSRKLNFFFAAQSNLLVQRSSISSAEASALQRLRHVTSHVPNMAQWKKTSPPVALKDTRRGGWRLKLNYTQSRRKKTLAKFSRYFETEEEARATATWWRLSWEQGNKGNYVDPHTDPDEVSSPATADLPKGEFSDCCRRSSLPNPCRLMCTADFNQQLTRGCRVYMHCSSRTCRAAAPHALCCDRACSALGAQVQYSSMMQYSSVMQYCTSSTTAVRS